ncbi:TIGR04282 family arsenosugar biosynthesis glycosyltransferase [Polaribacter tangerinus]|uniref:TIGR04282 family arsenosugar biosynthesis glycosyltransferase n=1 Tax=Polaribacter tangerinus TaxID=1920034 RepID=UPI000B4AC0A1|nr:TIGR04282 family arsenosugar biosynthesis glycosyltransferase [Polaribacter tangerinus]
MEENLLIIFTRNPELGKVKTRLAKKIGAEKALEIYKFLLQKTKEVTSKVTASKVVYYSVKVRDNDIWPNAVFQKKQQKGTDLGERMYNAFENGFNDGYKKILIIGSDLYDLTSEKIDNAFKSLEKNEVVLGPAKDGGYYLLGMKTIHKNLFVNKKWGGPTVIQDSLNDLADKKVFLLPILNDIDIFEDIEHHEAFKHFLK